MAKRVHVLTGGNPGATAYRADVVDDVLKAGPSFLPTKNIWCLKWFGNMFCWHLSLMVHSKCLVRQVVLDPILAHHCLKEAWKLSAIEKRLSEFFGPGSSAGKSPCNECQRVGCSRRTQSCLWRVRRKKSPASLRVWSGTLKKGHRIVLSMGGSWCFPLWTGASWA